jgi:hypothetical protein
MQNKNKFLFLIAILSFLISLSSPTRGWTDDKPSITIHNLINLTGIYAPISVTYEKGGKDFLAWVADQGGLDVDLNGKGDVEVKYLWAETGDDPAQFMAAYKRFRMGRARFSLIEMISYPKPRPFILEMWPSPNQEVKTLLERDGVVGYGVGFDSRQLYPPSWNFATSGSFVELGGGAMEYYIDHLWANRGKGIKAKVACLTWEKAYGKALDGLMKRHGEKTGKYEVVAELSFAIMPTDREVKEFLPDLEKKGIDIIWSNSTVQTSAAIMKGIHNLGLSKKIVLLANPGAPPDHLLEMVGPSLAEGYICPQSVFVPAVEPDEPGVKFARMLNEKYRKEIGLPNTLYMEGIRMKANMLESVRRALIGMMKRDHMDLSKACKWITGKDVKEFGAQTLSGYSAYDTTTKFQSAPSGKDDRRLTDHARLIAIKEGKLTVLSPWYKVPRLIPDEMLKQGLFKDEPLNINYLLAK